jgi:hypothetical protein
MKCGQLLSDAVESSQKQSDIGVNAGQYRASGVPRLQLNRD